MIVVEPGILTVWAVYSPWNYNLLQGGATQVLVARKALDDHNKDGHD